MKTSLAASYSHASSSPDCIDCSALETKPITCFNQTQMTDFYTKPKSLPMIFAQLLKLGRSISLG